MSTKIQELDISQNGKEQFAIHCLHEKADIFIFCQQFPMSI